MGVCCSANIVAADQDFQQTKSGRPKTELERQQAADKRQKMLQAAEKRIKDQENRGMRGKRLKKDLPSDN